jgi:hypothetical protein
MFDWDPVGEPQPKLAVIETANDRPTATTPWRCIRTGAA